MKEFPRFLKDLLALDFNFVESASAAQKADRLGGREKRLSKLNETFFMYTLPRREREQI